MRLFLTPTFLLVSGLLVLAVLATRRRDRTIAAVSWTLFALAYLATTALVIGPLTRAWTIPAAAACDQPHPGGTFVVLTGGISSRARRPSDVELLSQATYRRTIAAVDLALQSPGSRLLISGGQPSGFVKEALAARVLALRLGWPAERVSTEDVSTDTYTSAVEVAATLRKENIAPPVILITSASHMRRALFAYHSAGIDVIACSTDAPDPYQFPAGLVPQASMLQKGSDGWREVAGLLVYKLRVALRAGS